MAYLAMPAWALLGAGLESDQNSMAKVVLVLSECSFLLHDKIQSNPIHSLEPRLPGGSKLLLLLLGQSLTDCLSATGSGSGHPGAHCS